jgi:hypothetical protein
MAIREINIGFIANDGTGDDIRTAFAKINENFTFIDQNLGLDNTALNVGQTGEGIFKQKVEGELQFKKLEAGNGISLTGNENTIVLEATSAGSLTISDGTTTDAVQVGADTLTFVGGTNITTSVTDNAVTINSSAASISQDPNPQLGADLDLNGNNIVGSGNININGTISATTVNSNLTGDVTGNVTGNVYDIDVRELESALTSFDFGPINGQFDTVIPYLLAQIDLDQGQINQPDVIGPDFGTFGSYSGS